MKHRGPAGASAENVAVGCADEACARRAWMQSPHHRANMMLGGCQAIASAVSKSGRRYWAMEIGGGGSAGGEAQRATFPSKAATRIKLLFRIKKAAARAAFFVCVFENGQLFDCPLVCASSLPMRLKRAFCSLLSEA